MTSKQAHLVMRAFLFASLSVGAVAGCGGSSSSKNAGQGGSGGILGADGGSIATSGGIIAGSGGSVGSSGGIIASSGGSFGSTGGTIAGNGGIIIGSGGVPANGGVQGDGGSNVSVGTGGSAIDASAIDASAIDASVIDVAVVPGTGGVRGTGGNNGTGGSIVTCGEPGFACCTGNACNGDGCCVSGICMTQGGTCVGLGGGICNAGACGICGGPGLPCCGADPTTGACTAPNTTCNSGTCAKCGDVGLACCAGPAGSTSGVCSGQNTICGNTNLCVPCGTPGTACCPGNLCTSPGCCYDNLCLGENTACGTSAGTCQVGRCSGCGGAAQPCCSSSTCYDGLLCKSGTCTPCGGSGEACCPASSADGQCKAPGTACTSTGSDGVCARCGSLGDICCAGNTCNDGCCSGGRCILSPGGCSPDGGSADDAPIGQCATGGAPCSALARFTGTQILDGNDDEFCNIPSFELNAANAVKINEYNGTGGTYLERAVARVAWDAVGIHAFIRVYDTTFTPGTSLQLWNGDGVELFFSSSTAVTGYTYYDANTLHVIASPPLAQSSKDYGGSGTQTALPTSQYLTGSDATGYWIEMSLPWPGTAPTAGSQINFDLQLNVADGPASLLDLYTRDADLVFYLGTVTGTGCGLHLEPYCDDRSWCTTTLQP